MRATGLKALRAGDGRTIAVTFRVGRSARIGTHAVRVQLSVDGARVTRTVKVRVGR